MCVIILCENEFPSLETLESAESLNAHGGGIAWIEDGKVRYKKAVKAKEIFDITTKIQLPAIIHFRIASVGEVVEELCHPFQINDNANYDLEGTCEAVLFHNGTWIEWKDYCLRAITSKRLPKGIEFPKDKFWSDSRAMAWLADKFGTQILSLISNDNKIAVLTPQGIQKFGKFVEVEKNLCSNDYFKYRGSSFGGFGNLWKKNFLYNDSVDTVSAKITESNPNQNKRKLSKKERKELRRKMKLQKKMEMQARRKLKDIITLDEQVEKKVDEMEQLVFENDIEQYEKEFALQEKIDRINVKKLEALRELDDIRSPSSFFEQSAIKSRNYNHYR